MGSSQAGSDPSDLEDLAGFEPELAEALLAARELGEVDLERARKLQGDTGCHLAEALLGLGLVGKERLHELRVELLRAAAPPRLDEELISQDSFEAIYQGGESALPPAGRTRPLGPGEVRAPVQRALPPLEGGEPPPAAETAKPSAAPEAPADAPGAPPLAAPAVAAVADPAPEPAEAEVELELVKALGGDEPAATPAELSEARALLARASDRGQVGEILARHALGKAPRVVVLGRRGPAWVGWTGAGTGIRGERVARLVVPPVPGTLFGLVANTGGHYLGPLSDHPVHQRFFRTLGVDPADSAGLFPVHYDGRIEMALYLDAGPGGRLSSDVGEVLLVAQEVPRVLARIERG